ncbi:MAG: class I SAM-dependent RNA methyltransferase [Deltaproteobacteria bacterium]|nr:class I SAM-dependent RNA methyltransferase [Deltaproteobacteria bacterium]
MRLAFTIDGLAPGGEGVGRAGGRTLFVAGTAPGDRVEVEVPAGEGPAHAGLLRVLVPGTSRVEPPCGHFGTCGGCEWLHVAYPEQLRAKERAFWERLRKLGGLDLERVEARPILASPQPLRYRTRAKLHHDRQSGRLAFFRRRSHLPVPLAECHLLEEPLDGLREALGPAIAAARLEPREVALEWSTEEGRGSALLRLPALSAETRRRAEALLRALPSLSGLVLEAEGGPLATAGQPVLRHRRDPGDPAAGRCRSRPDVFQQANRRANALLVRVALSLLAPEGEEVLELFCGAGNFTGPLAARARSLSAVEVQGPALELARADAAEAPRPGLRFFAGDALKLGHALAREGRRFGGVLLDPPREGARGIGPLLRELQVPRAVYVSCDPATLARDLEACTAAGYRVAAVQPVDMFPQTHHVEGVALLVRA